MNLKTINGKNKKILIISFDIILFNISYWLSYNIRDEELMFSVFKEIGDSL